jgi:valyl-tRNA synthetase
MALVRLLAPFVPHLAEAIYRQVSGQPAESVHLAGWPMVGDGL